jgi:hypothetical protein
LPAVLPLYCVLLLQLQTALEHLLDKYGVDVALSGHHHR